MTPSQPSPKRASLAGVAYSLVTYLLGVAGLGYWVLFMIGLAPTGIDDAPRHDVATAVVINLGLILLWGVQHSVMAREGFKRWWTRITPAHTERATYCMASGLALALVCWGWSPIGGTLFEVTDPALSAMLTGFGLTGVLVLLAASFEIDHFELFGLRQPVRAWLGKEPSKPAFQERFLYSVVRHPIQLGVLMVLWITPHMTLSRLLFAVAMTAYVHVGLFFEERALVREHGDTYRAYQRRVPKVLPFTKGLRPAPAPAESAA